MRWSLVSMFLLAAVPAQAFTNLGLARYVSTAVAEGEVYVDTERRQDMARGILTYWSNLDERLPRLSPGEQDWLDAELKSNDATRISRATETREYHLYQASQTLDYCLESTGRLVDGYADDQTAQLEMLFWTDVANCYHRSHDRLTDWLEEAGLKAARNEGDGATLDGDILTSILTVVVPSAMADGMGWTVSPG